MMTVNKVCKQQGKWCIYWSNGKCLAEKCRGAQLFVASSGEAEKMSPLFSLAEKQHIRGVYEVIRRDAVALHKNNRIAAAEAEQVRRLADYYLQCWYFK